MLYAAANEYCALAESNNLDFSSRSRSNLWSCCPMSVLNVSDFDVENQVLDIRRCIFPR